MASLNLPSTPAWRQRLRSELAPVPKGTPVPNVPNVPKPAFGTFGSFGMGGSIGTAPVGGVVLDDLGLPDLPCATCGGTNFWAPADGPAEFGLWACCQCSPAPQELLCHACAVPGGHS